MADALGRLRVDHLGKTRKIYTLTQHSVGIGRSPENSLTLELPPVSDRHAEVFWTAQGFYIKDLDSEKGTIVNGVQLKANQPVLLEAGANIKIGPYTLVFEASAEPTPAGPVKKDGVDPTSDQKIAVETPPIQGGTVKQTPPVKTSPQPPEEPVVLPPPPPPKERHPAPPPPGPRSSYLRFLPSIFEDGDFLGRYLMIFESVWEPLEWRLDNIQLYFDPRTAPIEMVNWLGSWLGLPYDPDWPEAWRRQLVAQGMDILRFRGTAHGLSRVIELCTGLVPQIDNDPALPNVFRISLVVPEDKKEISRGFLKSLIEVHKPAHAGYVLEVVKQSEQKAG